MIDLSILRPFKDVDDHSIQTGHDPYFVNKFIFRISSHLLETRIHSNYLQKSVVKDWKNCENLFLFTVDIRRSKLCLHENRL